MLDLPVLYLNLLTFGGIVFAILALVLYSRHIPFRPPAELPYYYFFGNRKIRIERGSKWETFQIQVYEHVPGQPDDICVWNTKYDFLTWEEARRIVKNNKRPR